MSLVRIFDTTLRDGEQAPGFSMNIEEKLVLARQIGRLGVDVIEAGFSASSQQDFDAVRAIAEEVGNDFDVTICSLARATEKDIERSWCSVEAAMKPRIHTFLATSDIHLQYKLEMTREQALRTIEDAVCYARSLCEDVEFSAEDASRTDLAFLEEAMRVAIEAGANTINLPDTVGYALPEETAARMKRLAKVAKAYPGVILSTHCHDDLGLAVANSLAAVRAGARQVECTLNGIGERAGNAALEEVVMALRTRGDELPFTTQIDTEQIFGASRLLQHITANHVQANKAIVGENAFAHEAGIHQHGMIQERSTYEIMRPRDVGRNDEVLVLGKHSGRHAFKKRLEGMGIQLGTDRLWRSSSKSSSLWPQRSGASMRKISWRFFLTMWEGVQRSTR